MASFYKIMASLLKSQMFIFGKDYSIQFKKYNAP